MLFPVTSVTMELSERKFVPVFILGALVPEVIALCCRNWIDGYYGDVVVMTLCPWRLCLINCLQCSEKKPTISCFWIQDWRETGFETFGLVAHLEYWTLSLLTLGLLLDILDWVHSVIRRPSVCHIELRKPTIIVLIVAGILSTLSVSLFGAKIHQSTSQITTYEDVHKYYGWPYIARLLASLFAWLAAASAILCHYRALRGTLQLEEDSVPVLPPERDLYLDSTDEAENGALL